MNFSERYGFKEEKAVQLTTMDDELRHCLWNELENLFNYINYYPEKLLVIWKDFFKQPLYILDNDSFYQREKIIRSKYYKMPWYEVYSFLEFSVHLFNPFKKNLFIKGCNLILDRENSAYRFVDDLIVPIISEIEIKSIEKNLVDKDEAAQHLRSALTMLANKQNDQSRESIVQSILAIEAIAKRVTNDKNATLAYLCQKRKIIPSNNQARQALLNLYNYTSSKEGIRHSLTNESQFLDSRMGVLYVGYMFSIR